MLIPKLQFINKHLTNPNPSKSFQQDWCNLQVGLPRWRCIMSNKQTEFAHIEINQPDWILVFRHHFNPQEGKKVNSTYLKAT